MGLKDKLNLDTTVNYQYPKNRGVMPEYINDSYTKDTIKAVDAKFEAQKIAFAPLVFQAVKALLELGLLQVFSDSGEKGLTLNEAAQAAGIPVYAAEVLIEIALGMNIVKVLPSEERYVLGKIGWFLLEDEMTKVNFNFVNDVCYKGAFELTESLKTGKPRALRSLPPKKIPFMRPLQLYPNRLRIAGLPLIIFIRIFVLKKPFPLY
jgi:hypothetical protein